MNAREIYSITCFQTTNNQISLEILCFDCILWHQIDSRPLVQYLMNLLRKSPLIMKRTMEPAGQQAHNQKCCKGAWWAGAKRKVLNLRLLFCGWAGSFWVCQTVSGLRELPLLHWAELQCRRRWMHACDRVEGSGGGRECCTCVIWSER